MLMLVSNAAEIALSLHPSPISDVSGFNRMRTLVSNCAGLLTYQKPRDPDRPLVCLDQTSKQLIVETRTPIPAAWRTK